MRTKKKKRVKNTIFVASMVLSIGGCGGEFSYKRGAGMTDLQKQKESCADQNTKENEIEKCLQNSGWIVVGANKPLIARQPEPTVTPSVTQSATPIPAVTRPGKAAIVDQEPIKEVTNSLDRIDIGSWWKAGAGPDKLLADGESCALQLGNEYKPEGNMSIVTIGLVRCMKDKGWFALREK